MPFGVMSGIGLGMDVLNFGGDHRRGRGSFGGEFGSSHCNQWGLCCVVCVEVHEPIKLSFGLVSVVGPVVGVLDGGQHAARGKREFQEVLGSFLPH